MVSQITTPYNYGKQKKHLRMHNMPNLRADTTEESEESVTLTLNPAIYYIN